MSSKNNNIFEKSPLSAEELIDLLEKRNLVISDKENSKHIINFVGYYRLSGYMASFYKNPSNKDHIFRDGTKFESIIESYNFDRELRIICLGAIEKIEVGFRSILSNVMSLELESSHWFENADCFEKDNRGHSQPENKNYHSEFIKKLENTLGKNKQNPNLKGKKSETFIDHYHKTYDFPNLPPSWMVFETLSFGDVSFCYKNLKIDYRKKIAHYFCVHEKILASWIHAICYLRNLCAHHSRILNRKMSIRPISAHKYKDLLEVGDIHRFYAHASIIKIILDTIEKENSWSDSLKCLLKKFDGIKGNQMGFPDNWDGFDEL